MNTMTIREYDQLVVSLMNELRTVKAERDELILRKDDLLRCCGGLGG